MEIIFPAMVRGRRGSVRSQRQLPMALGTNVRDAWGRPRTSNLSSEQRDLAGVAPDWHIGEVEVTEVALRAVG